MKFSKKEIKKQIINIKFNKIKLFVTKLLYKQNKHRSLLKLLTSGLKWAFFKKFKIIKNKVNLFQK